MTATNEVEKTIGEQMADLLQRKPKNFDVVFCVGPKKIKVKAVKLVLKAASPVLEREFDENWETGVMVDGNGIPLPNAEPTSFQLFVNLLILDAWSLDSIKSLKLSPENLLNLLGLCRGYEITKAIKNLEVAADECIQQSFCKYKETDEFFGISRENLETMFSFDNLPLDEIEIFKCATRWAGNQCMIKGLDPTGENYRKVLGGCLFEIRFPTMSNEEFTEAGRFKKNILKGEEKLDIYEYIGLNICEKTNYDKTQLQFKTEHRAVNANSTNSSSPVGCSVLSLPPQYKLPPSPSFVCNGVRLGRRVQVNQKISLLGIGFLGPVDEDTNFKVTVRIKRMINHCYEFDSGTLMKNIFAPKGKNFRFLFNEPITVESNTYDPSWENRYDIFFSLEGSNNVSQYKVANPEEELVQASGVKFRLSRGWNNGSPMTELLFTKI